MAISFAESRLAPLVETDPAWKPFGLFSRLPPAMEMLEEEFTEEALPRFGGRLRRSRSWSGYAAHRVAADRRAAGKVSSDAIAKKCAQGGDDDESPRSTACTPSPATTWATDRCGDDDESPCSTTCTVSHKCGDDEESPSSTMTWATDSEEGYEDELAQFEAPRRHSIAGFVAEGYEDELAQFEAPRRHSIAGFVADTPVRAFGAGAPSAAAAAGAHAGGGAAPRAPPQRAPQLVTTLMVQNLDRSLTRRGFMNSLDKQGFAGKYDFVHLPKSLGTRRNNGFAFVNFVKLEDAEEFARSVARINGSKVRAVPAAVQGSANAAKARSRKTNRIRDSHSRPLVVGGHGQDALLQA